MPLKGPGKKWRRIFGISYLVILFYLLFFAPFRTGTLHGINLVPFNSYDEMAEMFRPSSFLYWLVNVPGNFLAFVPIPLIIYPLMRREVGHFEAIIWGLFVPWGIEFCQYFFSVGFGNIDDVLLNFFGMCFGYVIYRTLKRKRAKTQAFSSQIPTN